MTMLWINLASVVLPFILKLFFKKKEDKDKALIRFQKWIQARKHYALMAGKAVDDYDRQIAAIDKRIAELKEEKK